MTEKEQLYKLRIGAELDKTVQSGFVPELGEYQKGKVRDVHFSGDNVIMVASDRVSAFDEVLVKHIPFKGVVLNILNQWAMDLTEDIVPNASVESPDPNVVIQKKMKNIGFECIVRGFVWGSMAKDYEEGKREKSGIALPDGLLRYQKLDEPIFTPTTKAKVGHDEDITLEDIAKAHGNDVAQDVKDLSIALYNRGVERAEQAGMLLLDTKFEFGFDENKHIYLIDECKNIC